jgi:hypothetical protein
MDETRIVERIAGATKMDRSTSKRGNLVMLYWRLPTWHGSQSEVNKLFKEVESTSKKESDDMEKALGSRVILNPPRIYAVKGEVVVGASATVDASTDYEQVLFDWRY